MKKYIHILMILVLLPYGINAQTSLLPGDIALITVNADGDKNFDCLCLRDIQIGTVIKFTDDAWINGSGFRGSEGILTYTATNFIPGGSIISCPSNDGGNGFIESGSFNPSGSGDNILVFQGPEAYPTFVFGAGWARGSSVWEYSETAAGNRSDIPPGLSAEEGSISLPGTSDNYQYNINIGTQGNKWEILQWICDANNYHSNNTTAHSPLELAFTLESNFTIGSGENLSWSHASWSNGMPNIYSKVEIDGQLFISSDVHIGKLIIPGTSLLEILPGASLILKDSLINQGTCNSLILRSDETGTGQIVHPNAGQEGTVERFVSGNQWHFVSSPIENPGNINDLFGEKSGDLYGIYYYDETAASWQDAGGLVMDHQKAYNVYYENNSYLLRFRGLLNSFPSSSHILLSLSTGKGWNLIGNPFPSSLDWGNCENDDACGWTHQNQRTKNKTIYITTGGTGENTSFATYNGHSGVGVPDNNVRYIATGQGFWVKATENGFLDLDNQARSSYKAGFKKNVVQRILRISLLCENKKDQTALCIFEKAKETFDQYDSERLGNASNLKIYTVADSKYLVINAVPFPLDSLHIPVQCQLDKPGPACLSFEGDLGCDLDVRFFDLKEKRRINPRSQKQYDFQSLDTLIKDRFYMKIMPGIMQKSNIIYSDKLFSIQDNALRIPYSNDNKTLSISIYNLSGKLLLQKTMNAGEIFELTHIKTQGILFIRAICGNKVQTVKIFVKQY